MLPKQAQLLLVNKPIYLLWRLKWPDISNLGVLFFFKGRERLKIPKRKKSWGSKVKILSPGLPHSAKFILVWSIPLQVFSGGSEAQSIKNPPAMQEIWVPSLSWEDPLEEIVTTYSSILAWRIPCTEEPGRLYSPWFAKSQTNHILLQTQSRMDKLQDPKRF